MPIDRKSAVEFAMQQGWLITQAGFELVLAVASVGRENLFAEVREKALEARAGVPLGNDRPRVDVSNAVAVIPVNGPLMRHASMMSDISGATSYDSIRDGVKAAFESPAVKDIVMHFNTPGGVVTGLAETADLIASLRGKGKKILAVVDS